MSRPKPGRPSRWASCCLPILLFASCAQPAPSASSDPQSTPREPAVRGTTQAPTSRTETAPPDAAASPPSVASDSPSRQRCRQLVAGLTQDQVIGQLFMVGVDSAGLSRGAARRIRAAHAGSVIFLGNSTSGARFITRLVRKVRAAVGAPRGVATLVAVDQEGGRVQRLRGPGFSRIPSANRQSRWSDTRLRRNAHTWGRQLKRAGIDANLAPVADVVPKKLVNVNQPIGVLHRGYGPKPAVVAAKVGAFVAGMDAAGIATAVKHFPGLGRVRGNTDVTAHVVDSATTLHDKSLAGFARGAKAGVDMVMVSSAFYPRIDATHRAAFSSTVIGTGVRRNLHFDGVVISDDLAARAMLDLAPGERALRFLRAGGDLVIVGDSRQLPAMVKAVAVQARSDRHFAASLTEKAARVVALKARRGLAPCG